MVGYEVSVKMPMMYLLSVSVGLPLLDSSNKNRIIQYVTFCVQFKLPGILRYFIFICFCMCICADTHVQWHMLRNKRAACRSWFHQWVLGIEFRLPGFIASAIPNLAISLAFSHLFLSFFVFEIGTHYIDRLDLNSQRSTGLCLPKH